MSNWTERTLSDVCDERGLVSDARGFGNPFTAEEMSAPPTAFLRDRPCPAHAGHDLLCHAREVTAGAAYDVEEARQLLSILGLVDDDNEEE